MSEQIIMAVVGVFLTLLTGMAFFLLRQTSQALRELREQNQSLALKAAVSEERNSHLSGTIDTLVATTREVTKDVGRISSSIERIWLILEDAKIAPKRKLTAQDG